MAETEIPNLRGLKAVVVVMGVIIVVGLVVVVVTIANRLGGMGKTGPGFGTVDVAVPAGCEVVETVSDGTRLILRFGSGERCRRIVIVDLATGRTLGTVNLTP